MTFRYPSRFIFNVSLKNVSSVNELSNELIDQAQSYILNKECVEARGPFLFRLDDKVNHKVFGNGVVVSLQPNGMLEIQFDRFNDPRLIHQFSVHLLDGERTEEANLSDSISNNVEQENTLNHYDVLEETSEARFLTTIDLIHTEKSMILRSLAISDFSLRRTSAQ